MESPPFEAVAGQLDLVKRSLLATEMFARTRLPGLRWDFGQLLWHLDQMAALVRAGLPEKAYQEHLRFSVTPPGKLMALLRGKSPDHVVSRWRSLAGKKRSPAKTAASRLNLEKARGIKNALRNYGTPEQRAVRLESTAIRRLLRRLKYRESLAAKARQSRVPGRAQRCDTGRRARRIEEIQQKLRVLEEKRQSLQPRKRRWGPIPNPSDERLISPGSQTKQSEPSNK